MNEFRWQNLMAHFGVTNAHETYTELLAAYSEKHRYYHTKKHIDHCLAELDDFSSLAHEPHELELSLWFHDAIYNPYSSGNEENSADWACEFLQRHSVSSARIERVREHILATKHQSIPKNMDSQLLVDIDLAILGADQDKYAEFEMNIRKEYRWVPRILFNQKRIEILKSFIDRPGIYNTYAFKDRYEENARSNITLAIKTLSA